MTNKEFDREETRLVAKEKLKALLRKLGLRSIKETMFGNVLTEAELISAINRIQSDFGKSDVVLMDQDTLAAFNKHFK